MMKTMPNVKPTGYRTESWKKPDYNCARKLYRFNVIAHGSLNFTPSSWNYGKLFKFAMSTVPNITRIERSDDIPLLIAQMEKMEVAALLDKHLPTHGNWQSGWATSFRCPTFNGQNQNVERFLQCHSCVLTRKCRAQKMCPTYAAAHTTWLGC